MNILGGMDIEGDNFGVGGKIEGGNFEHMRRWGEGHFEHFRRRMGSFAASEVIDGGHFGK